MITLLPLLIQCVTHLNTAGLSVELSKGEGGAHFKWFLYQITTDIIPLSQGLHKVQDIKL